MLEVIKHSYAIHTQCLLHAKCLMMHLAIRSVFVIILTDIISDQMDAILNCNETQGHFVYHLHASCSLIVLYRFFL